MDLTRFARPAGAGPAPSLRRAARRIGPALLLAAALGAIAPPSRAAPPEVGKVLSGAIEVRLAKKLPLPPGQWRVETVFEESAALTNEGAYRKELPVHVVVLANEQRGEADIQALVIEYTDSADVSWTGQPCDSAPANAPLAVNTFGTTSSSLKILCNRVFAFANLRAAVQRGAQNTNTWLARRFEKLRDRAPWFPVHGLVANGYMAAPRGDRVLLVAYANPGLAGLDAATNEPHPFRGNATPAAKQYLAAFAEWFDSYTQAVDAAYLRGRDMAVPAFRSGPGRAAGAGATGTATAGAPAPAPPSAAAPPAAAPPAATTAAGGVPPASPPAAPARSQTVHALVIGNGAYKGAPLANPRNDAQAISERFRRFGFVVHTVFDASRRQMVNALTQFTEAARDADVSIVFYAGHGVQVNGVNYLIPVDMDLASSKALGVAFEAVSLNALVENHLPGKAKLVFLDACRDNPLARSLSGARGGARGLAAVNAATGTLISYATRDGSTASDGAGANSPYTAALLAHIDETEDISIVLRRVRQRVMDSTRGAQEPWEYGSLVGDKLVLSQISRSR